MYNSNKKDVFKQNNLVRITKTYYYSIIYIYNTEIDVLRELNKPFQCNQTLCFM